LAFLHELLETMYTPLTRDYHQWRYVWILYKFRTCAVDPATASSFSAAARSFCIGSQNLPVI